MASYTLSPVWGAGAQLFDNNGNPLAGGKIYVFEAGTTTPATTYTNPLGTAANTNPIIADAAGRLSNEIWFLITGSFKFVLKDSNDTLIATYDSIPSAPPPPITNDASSVSYDTGYVVTAGSFTVGATYKIATVGSTNFVAIGAASNSVGVIFTATAAGSGSGTANYIRTVESKLRDTVSVKDFGAVGDGVTDDAPAIQAALNAGLIVSGGNTNYGIASSITVPTGVTLRDIQLTALTPNMNMVLVNNYSKLSGVILVGTGSFGVERGVYPAVDGASDVEIDNITVSNISVAIHAQPLSVSVPARWRITGMIYDVVGIPGASEGYGVLLSPATQCVVNVTCKNIRRHAIYLSAGASQNNVYSSVDGCGNYAVQLFSLPTQPATEGNVIRGAFKNLTEDVSGQVGAVAIVAKAHNNDISIEMSGDNAAKGVWIEGTNSAVGPYPTNNLVHDSMFYGAFSGTPISAVYADQTVVVNNVISASYPAQAIAYIGSSLITVTSAGLIDGNTIDAQNVGSRGITNSYECVVYVSNNDIINTTANRFVDFSTLKARSGFNKSFTGSVTIPSVPSLGFGDATVTIPNNVENPKPFTTVSGGSVSSLAILTSIATLPVGSPQTFVIRAYNGHSAPQNIGVFWTVYGD